MNAPHISVVMAAYNAEKYLAAAMDSILAQSERNFELIVVDDASTDGTLALLNTYAARDDRVIVLRHDSNQGQARAANTGLERARGRLIARHDADDVSFPDRFARQVEFLERHPEIALCGTATYVIDDDGRPVAPKPLVTDPDRIYAELREKRNWIVNGSTMFRAELGARYRPKILCEEFDLFLRWCAEGRRLANLSDCLYQYRLSPGHLTSTKKLTIAAHAEASVRFHDQRLEGGDDDYLNWDPAAAVEEWAATHGAPPSDTDPEFVYRRGLLYAFHAAGMARPALGEVWRLLTRVGPWRIGARWIGVCGYTALAALARIVTGRAKPRGEGWPVDGEGR